MSIDTSPESLTTAEPVQPVGSYQFDEYAGHGDFEPLTAKLQYTPPKRTINPDQSLGWIRRVAPIVRAHWVSFTVALTTALLAIVTRVLVPLVVGSAINDALVRPPATRTQLSHYVILLGILTVCGFATGFVSRFFLFRTAYSIEYDLRVLMYRHLTRMSFGFYDRVQSGQLISRANSDIRSVQMFLAFGPFFIVQFGLFGVALFFMLQINVGLTLIALVTLPFVYKVGVTMRRYMFPLSWVTMARTADIATIVDENINGVRVIKSFAAEKQQITDLAVAAESLRWISVKMIWARARFGPLIENLTRIGEAFILLYGGILVIDGKIGPGDLLVFLAYLALLQAPFRMLGFVLMMQQRGAASAQRIYEVLDEVSDIQDKPGAVDIVDCRGQIDIEDAGFAFDDGPKIFDGLNLHIPAGPDGGAGRPHRLRQDVARRADPPFLRCR